MPSTISLIDRLIQDYPQFTFAKGEHFHWSPSEQTIYFTDDGDDTSLLHEVAHAVLGHKEYPRDIKLIAMEREAWEYAVNTLADIYDTTVSQEYIEEMLDTYRDWLHNRSICPECKATGVQSAKKEYRCAACHTTWRVNDARTCALRRYRTTK